MSEPYKFPPIEVLKHWISSLFAPSVRSKLSDWEEKFIVSIDKQFNKSYILSRAQCEKLEELYAEKTS